MQAVLGNIYPAPAPAAAAANGEDTARMGICARDVGDEEDTQVLLSSYISEGEGEADALSAVKSQQWGYHEGIC
eukprot:scaffold14437_cov22-Tisochrysis_lutea.AAC.2